MLDREKARHLGGGGLRDKRSLGRNAARHASGRAVASHASIVPRALSAGRDFGGLPAKAIGLGHFSPWLLVAGHCPGMPRMQVD